jgi:DNA-binding transcriptional MerR regulator
MFYEEIEIGELVICPYCKHKYNDPRIVGCGTSFCMSCIQLLTKNGQHWFGCPVCDEFHEQPRKGYLKNTTLAKLCEKKANKVYRSPLADALETQLNELKLNMDKSAKENDLGVDKIKEYCDGLKKEVQLHLEELTESLNKQSLELIERIDEYENETKLESNKNKSQKLDAILIETRTFHQKWADYLKQFKIDDVELSLASNEAKKLQYKLKKVSQVLLLCKDFKSNLEFKKGATVLGSLVVDNAKQSYIQALSSIKPYNTISKIEGGIKSLSFKLLSNGNLCVAYRKNTEAFVRIAVFDKDLNMLAQKLSNSDVYQRF